MATSIPRLNNAKCAECKNPVVITIPIDHIGNAYGQEWFCEKCNKNLSEILI